MYIYYCQTLYAHITWAFTPARCPKSCVKLGKLCYIASILHILIMDYFKTPYKHPDQFDSSIILTDRDVPLFGATFERVTLLSQ